MVFLERRQTGLKSFEYLKPQSLGEACLLLGTHGPEARVLAGGTDLIVRMRDRQVTPRYVIDLKGIPGIASIAVAEDGDLVIGAGATLNAVAESTLVQGRYQILSQAAHSVGSYQVRNRATLVGNICNASPAADIAPALMALEAVVQVCGPLGDREISVGSFFAGPGKTVLGAGELVRAVRIPAIPYPSKGVYLKHSRRKAVDLAMVGVAVLVVQKPSGPEVRIALGAVAPTPIRAPQAEDLLNRGGFGGPNLDLAAAAAAEGASPITDVRASREYRAEMVRVLCRRAVEGAISPHPGAE